MKCPNCSHKWDEDFFDGPMLRTMTVTFVIFTAIFFTLQAISILHEAVAFIIGFVAFIVLEEKYKDWKE